MTLMIKTDTLRPTPQITPAPAAADVLFYTVAESELGTVLVARSAKGVCAILLDDSAEALTADLAHRFPQSMLVASEAPMQEEIETVLRYIATPSVGLHLTLDMRGTPFQRRVWEKLQAIPVGHTISYRELAKWVSPRANPRAVANACAANSIALAIPCHRAIRRNGSLAGYRWGIERKRDLIRKETLA